MENPKVLGETPRLQRLLQAVIALVDSVVAAIRARSPAQPLMDQVLVVGSPLLDLVIQLAASPILVSLLSVAYLLTVAPNGQRFLLVLAPAALASVALITLIHVCHRKLAQVRTGAWFRRARCDRKQMRAFKRVSAEHCLSARETLEKFKTLDLSGLQRCA